MPTKKQLEEQIKELKLENQDLREEMGEPATIFGERVWSILYEKDYCPTSYGEAASFIKDIIEENEKLEEESEKLAAERNKLEEENEKLNKLMIYEHTSCYDGRMMLVKTLWEKEEDWRDRIDLDFPYINEEIIKLKEENEKLKEELKAGICIGEYLAGEFKKNPH